MKNAALTYINRREFIVTASALAAAPSVLGDAKRVFKVGLVGCGGRGAGAARDIAGAAKKLGCEVKFTGFADFFLGKAKEVAAQWNVDEKFAFGGANGYKGVLATDCDIVILATPPVFRARQLQAAVDAGKHTFVEKPIAADARGVRDFLAAAANAKAKGLSVQSGTCMRYKRDVVKYLKPVRDGEIGRIVAGRVYRCHGAHSQYMRLREPKMTNAAYLCNAWYAFYEMSGDHLNDQALHEQDLANWFIGRYPESAIGNGARWQRPIGDGFDEFSVDFDYGSGLHVATMARHVDGCEDPRGCHLVGTEGEVFVMDHLTRYDGRAVALDANAEKTLTNNGYAAEHEEFLRGLLDGKPVNNTDHVAMSTATCIMGTLACYSGHRVTMDDILNPNPSAFMRKFEAPFTPKDFEETEDVPMPPDGRSRFMPGHV